MEIFHEKEIPKELTSALIFQWKNEHKCPPKVQKIRRIKPPVINYDMPWDFFDGASQGSPPLAGAG